MKPSPSHSLKALPSLIWLLALALLMTILVAWLVYPLEIDWLGLETATGLPKPVLWHNYHKLLTYLTNPLVQTLQMQDFPSSKEGLKHFADVKRLFHLAQLVFLGTSWQTLSFFRQGFRKRTLWAYQRVYLIAALAPLLLLGLGLMIGFSDFFTLFHHLLFPGDSSWLFDPQTDPIITALPEAFFYHCFLIFGCFYESLMITGYLFSRKMAQAMTKTS
ncbi:TIGR01906 family membrane protein [Streptococcus pluranimalium]|uniref:TIGR01906 family membrane protein n=1 Tax=Streptococcus pluranimalium TaxID=82348 RepID=UPI0039FBC27C